MFDESMKDKTELELMDIAIKHWEDNVALQHDDKCIKSGATQCVLCFVYNEDGINDDGEIVENCMDDDDIMCPIAKHTGSIECEDTPYFADDTDAVDMLACLQEVRSKVIEASE